MEVEATCNEFVANAWKKDLCANCQKHESEHGTSRETSAVSQSADIKREQQHKEVVTAPAPSKLQTTPATKLQQVQQQNKGKPATLTAKPQRLVARSESARCKPTPPAKPSRLQERKPVVRAESQRLVKGNPDRTKNIKKRVSPEPNKRGAANQNSVKGGSNTTEAVETSLEAPVLEKLVEGCSNPTEPSETKQRTQSKKMEDEAEFHERQTLQNTLKNLNLETSKSDVENIDSLHKSFLNLQEHEHLHESPFHKLSAKIKHHHNRHLHHHHHGNHNGTQHGFQRNNHHSSDQTKAQTTHYQNPVVDPSSGKQPDSDSTKERPISVYDNVEANREKKVERTVDTSGYDNAKVTLSPQLNTASPKYDLVAKEMSASHESNQSERIYAEVVDVPDSRTETGNNSISIYEELSVCLTAANQVASQPEAAEEGENKLELLHVTPEHGLLSASSAVSMATSATSRPANRKSFFKTFLKKGKKSETIGHSTGQRFDSLEKGSKSLSNYMKDKQTVVDHWVMEQNTANRLEVSGCKRSPSPVTIIHSDVITEKIGSKKAALSVSADHSRGSKGETSDTTRGGTSPRETLQRPDKKPPPPPASTASTKSAQSRLGASSMVKSTDKRMSLVNNNNNLPLHELKGNKMVLIKEKNGEFVPTNPSGEAANKKKVKIDERAVDGVYDEPWDDVDMVITKSILKMEESVSKSASKGGKQLKIPEPIRHTNGKRVAAAHVHTRQISMPETSRKVEQVKMSTKSGKISPLSATDSGYESTSTTATIRREHSSASDLTHNRIPVLPNSSNIRTPPIKPTPIDSLPLCLEQISAMNVLTLQKLTKAFAQKDNSILTEKTIVWEDLVIENIPIHSNTRCVFYNGRLAQQPAQNLTIMLSLRKPQTCKSYTPNLLDVGNQFLSDSIDLELLPQQLRKSHKNNSSPNGSDSDSSSDKVTADCNKDSDVMPSTCVTLLRPHHSIESVLSFIKSRDSNSDSSNHLIMDSLYIILQVINIIFALAERQLQMESLSAGDLIISLDTDAVPTVYCHMISVKKYSADFSLTCEKLRMFMIQLTHASEKLRKSKSFNTVEDLIQSSSDAGDLKTIALIIQYLLWGPKDDEVKVMSVAENRKQAFDLWLHLSRAKLLNELVFQPLDKLKIYSMANFLNNTSGGELFKITKLLSTY